MRLKRPVRIVVKVGLWVGAVISAVHLWISLWGDWETARELFATRGPIMAALGAVLLTPWLWPAVAVGCFVAYLALEHKLPLRLAHLIKEPEPEPPKVKPRRGVAELLVLEPKAEAAYVRTLGKVMALIAKGGEHANKTHGKIKTASRGFRPEKVKERHLQIYMDYERDMRSDLLVLSAEVARLEEAGDDLVAVFSGIAAYSRKKSVIPASYVARAREMLGGTQTSVATLDSLAGAVITSADGQITALDETLEAYGAVLQRFRALQDRMASAYQEVIDAADVSA